MRDALNVLLHAHLVRKAQDDKVQARTGRPPKATFTPAFLASSFRSCMLLRTWMPERGVFALGGGEICQCSSQYVFNGCREDVPWGLECAVQSIEKQVLLSLATGVIDHAGFYDRSCALQPLICRGIGGCCAHVEPTFRWLSSTCTRPNLLGRWQPDDRLASSCAISAHVHFGCAWDCGPASCRDQKR